LHTADLSGRRALEADDPPPGQLSYA
jgi:hypothetical protein